MYQPLDRLTARQLVRAFAVMLCVLIVASVAMLILDRPLRTSGVTPFGMLGLEVAGDADTVQTISGAWRNADLLSVAAFNVGADYLYIPVYPLCLSLGCVYASRRVSSKALVTAGLALAWLQWLAGVFDAVENVALLKMIWGNTSPIWPSLARACR
jgi:hypothetical protein